MGVINFYESGLLYVIQCFKEFGGTTGVLAMFFMALVLLLLSGSVTERRVFLWPLLLLTVTVYNPVVVVLVLSKLGMTSVYYRFFWILPVVPLTAWAGVRVFEKAGRNRLRRITVLLLLFGCIILTGKAQKSMQVQLPSNRWKVEDDLLNVCELLKEHASREYPKVVLEFEKNLSARQYDAHLILTIDRDVALLFTGMSTTVSTHGLSDEEVVRQQVIMDCLYNRQKEYDTDIFMTAVEETETDFIVIDRDSEMGDYLEACGYEKIDETEESLIYRT